MKRSLSKKELLRKKAEIRLVFLSDKQFSVKGMKLYVRTNEGTGTKILVSLVRSYGNSVERNYARRVGKEIFRNYKDTILSDLDLAVVLYPGAYGFAEREQQFLTLMRRAHVLI